MKQELCWEKCGPHLSSWGVSTTTFNRANWFHLGEISVAGVFFHLFLTVLFLFLLEVEHAVHEHWHAQKEIATRTRSILVRPWISWWRRAQARCSPSGRNSNWEMIADSQATSLATRRLTLPFGDDLSPAEEVCLTIPSPICDDPCQIGPVRNSLKEAEIWKSWQTSAGSSVQCFSCYSLVPSSPWAYRVSLHVLSRFDSLTDDLTHIFVISVFVIHLYCYLIKYWAPIKIATHKMPFQERERKARLL